MTGLDQIIDQIRQDAEQIAARNKKQAEDEAEKILQQAREDAAQSVRLIEEKQKVKKKNGLPAHNLRHSWKNGKGCSAQNSKLLQK